MRKFTKVCLIIALVLGIAGSIFCVTGIVMGASWSAVENTVSDWADRGKSWFQWDFSDIADSKDKLNGKPYKEWEYSKEEVQELEVDAERAYVSIIENTRDDRIRVKVYSSRDQVELDRDDACLSIERKTKSTSLEKSPIQIEIPKGKHFNDASVNVGAGLLEIDNIEATELFLGVGAGELTATGKVKGMDTELDCGMGNVEITYLESESTTINCGMGNVTAVLSGTREQYQADLDCGLGNVNLGDESHSGISSLTTGPSNAPKNLEIECGMGNVDLTFNGTAAED